MLGYGAGIATRLHKARERLSGTVCDGTIELRNDLSSFACHDTIEGEAVLTAIAPKVELSGVWIQLEGVASSRFRSEIDKDSRAEVKSVKFFPDGAGNSENLEVTFIGKSFPRAKTLHLPPPTYAYTEGVYRFPFRIQIEEPVFPASFHSRFGQIKYKLVLYADIFDDTGLFFGASVLDEAVLHTNGYLNLSADPKLKLPVMITRKKDRSFFSKRTLFKVALMAEKKGYLPGERLTGVLLIENPSCECVEEIGIMFCQKVVYFDQRVRKVTTSALTENRVALDNFEPEIRWDFDLALPLDLVPTSRKAKQVLELLYSLQFAVRGANDQEIKGEAEIIIGTEALGEHTTLSRNSSTSSNGSAASSGEEPRKMSPEQKNDPLANSFGTLPPSYSTLSSRRSSASTLPPPYDTVCQELEDDVLGE